MKEPVQPPTLEEFLACCRSACEFLVRDYGFELLNSPREYNEFSVQYRKGEIGVDLYGENWGENASCSLFRGKDELDLVFLMPSKEPRSKKRIKVRPGQLEQVQILALGLQQRAPDFLRGDFTRFDSALAEWRRLTRPRQLTEAELAARRLQQAVSVAGHAQKRGDHAEVVRLLEPHAEELSPHQRRMLDTARGKVVSGTAVEHPAKAMVQRPLGITALSLLFMIGAEMALLSAVSLTLPGTMLDAMWKLNSRAYGKLVAMGPPAIPLMSIVVLCCAASAVGLWRGKRWGRVLAISLLTINLIASSLNAIFGAEPRTLVGIPIAGALIAYLFSSRVRLYFTNRRSGA